MKKKIFLFLAVTAAVSCFAAKGFSSYYGEIKPGLQFVQDNEKTSYFLFLPDSYDQTKKWPLVVAFPKFGSSTKKFMETWIPEAKRRSLIVVAPNWYKARETPEPGDKWVLKIIAEVIEKYGVDRKQVLVTGFEDGADYACYLAIRYPKEFSAAAPVGGAITPVYRKIVYYGRMKRRPLPFYFLVSKEDKNLASRELSWEGILKTVDELESRGVPVEVKEAKSWKGHFERSFIPEMLDWFGKHSGMVPAKRPQENEAIPAEKMPSKVQERNRSEAKELE